MENASKALIIAGAILLSILIIALGIYVFNMAKNATNTNSIDELEVSQFNSEFNNYRGRKLGSSVIDLLDKAVANATTYKDSDERLPDIIYLDTRTTGAKTSGNLGGAVSAVDTEDDNMKNAVGQAGLNDSAFKFAIISNSDDPNISTIGALRKIIAEKHYYQVQFVNNNVSGLIEYILIQY